jgi:transposase
MLRSHVDAQIARIANEGVDLQADLEPLVALCEALWRYIKVMDVQMSDLAKSIEICRAWMQIHGVGPIVALSFYSAVENPHRFARDTDVGAYLGLSPKISQSGTKIKRRGISHRGNRMTRCHLVTAATVHMKANGPDSDLKRWALALKDRRGGRRAVTALGRKLGIVMLSMWKTGEPFRPLNNGTKL